MSAQTLISRLQDEADLCRNEQATDVANLLDEAAAYIKGIEEALRAYQKINPLHNDLEAYLHHLGGWALKQDLDYADKPDPKDYGVAQYFEVKA